LLVSDPWVRLNRHRDQHFHRRRPAQVGLNGVRARSPWVDEVNGVSLTLGVSGPTSDERVAEEMVQDARAVVTVLVELLPPLLGAVLSEVEHQAAASGYELVIPRTTDPDV
jgi:hypothetical protein